jgi:hypothetical protein
MPVRAPMPVREIVGCTDASVAVAAATAAAAASTAAKAVTGGTTSGAFCSSRSRCLSCPKLPIWEGVL